MMIYHLIILAFGVTCVSIERELSIYQSYYQDLAIDLTMIDNFLIGGWSRFQPVRSKQKPEGKIISETVFQFLFQVNLMDPHESMRITALINFEVDSKLIRHKIYLDASERFELEHIIQNNHLYEGFWIFNYAIIHPQEMNIVIGIIDNTDSIHNRVTHGLNIDKTNLNSVYQISFGGVFPRFPLNNRQERLGYFFGTISFIVQSHITDLEIKNLEFLNLFQYQRNDGQDCNHYVAQEYGRTENSIEYKFKESIESDYSFFFWCKLSIRKGTVTLISIQYADFFRNDLEWNLQAFDLVYHLYYSNSPIIEIMYFSYDFPFFENVGEINGDIKKTERFNIDADLIHGWHSIFCRYDWQNKNLKILIENPRIGTVLVKFYESVNQLTGKRFIIKLGQVGVQENQQLLEFHHFYFLNCFKEQNYQNCYNSFCRRCFGPLEDNCIECSSFQEDLVFDSQQNKCLCPSDQINVIGLCLTPKTLIVTETTPLIDGIEESFPDIVCIYGYYLFQNRCLKCPSSLYSSVQCIECLVNWKTWILQPICINDWIIDGETNQKTYIDYYLSPKVYASILEELVYLPYVYKYCSPEDSICYKLAVTHLEKALYVVCQGSNCLLIVDFDEKTKSCKNHVDDQNTSLSDCQQKLCNQFCQCCNIQRCQKCVSENYFISLERFDCLECNIVFCKKCFQYAKNNFLINSLEFLGEPHSHGDDIEIGCALCIEDYQFNFQTGECDPKRNTLNNCEKSFITTEGHTVCFSSKVPEQNLPELIECDQYIPNCMVCVFDIQSSPLCTQCQEGYFEDLSQKSCIECSDEMAIQCSHDEDIARTLKVFGFYGSLVKREYTKLVEVKFYYSQSIKCNKDSFLFKFSKQCYKWQRKVNCTPKSSNGVSCFTEKYTLNYDLYWNCSEDCDLCIPQTSAEFPNLYFKDQNQIYKSRCLKSKEDFRIKNKYGYVQKCGLKQQLFLSKHEFSCQNEELIQSIDYYQESPDLFLQKFYHALQIAKKTYIAFQEGQFIFSYFDYFSKSSNWFLEAVALKIICQMSDKDIQRLTYIAYSELFFVNCIIKLNEPGEIFMDNIKGTILSLENTSIISSSKSMIFNLPSFTGLNFTNTNLLNLKLESLKLFNFTVQSKYTNEIFVALNNVTFENCQFHHSSIFPTEPNQKVNKIHIEKLRFINCTFFNSFILDGVQLRVELGGQVQIAFESCNFFNSTLLLIQNSLLALDITINDCYFVNSAILKMENPTGPLLVEVGKISIIRTIFSRASYLMSIIQIFQEGSLIRFKNLQILQSKLDCQFLIQIIIKGSIQIEDFILDTLDILRNENDTQSVSLFFINCTKAAIQKGKIIEQYHHQENSAFVYFVFAYVDHMDLSGLNLYSTSIQSISISRGCMNLHSKALMTVHNFESLFISNLYFSNYYSQGTSLIQIQDTSSFSQIYQYVNLQNISFQNCILIKTITSKLPNFLSLVTEKHIEVQMFNVTFLSNWIIYYDEYIQGPSLPYISFDLVHGIFKASQIRFQNNYLLGNKQGIWTINARNISLCNIVCDYYNFELLQLGDAFPIILKALTNALFEIKASTVVIETARISNALINDNGIFIFTLFDIGAVLIKDLQLNQISSMSASIQSLGFLFESLNSDLNLKIYNVSVQNSYSISGSVFYFKPTFIKSFIQITGITIQNYQSLSRSILYFQNPYDGSQSKIILENLIFNNLHDPGYEQKLKQLNLIKQQANYQESRISVISIHNSQVEIKNVFFSGRFFCPILNINFQKRLFINQIRLINLYLYQSDLVNITDLNGFGIIKLKIMALKNLQFSSFQTKNNCVFQKQTSTTNFTDCNQNTHFYSFERIIYLQTEADDFKSCIANLKKDISSLITISNAKKLLVNYIQISNVECSECRSGLLEFNNIQSSYLLQLSLQNNICGAQGCINFNGRSSYAHQLNLLQFINNTGTLGGAIYVNHQFLFISNTRFINNRAAQGGAIFKIGEEDINLLNIIFYRNQANRSLAIDCAQNFLDMTAIKNINIVDDNKPDQIYINQLPNRLQLQYEKSIIETTESAVEGNLIEYPQDQNLKILVPSGQKLSKYVQDDQKIGIEILLVPLSNLNEKLFDISDSECFISARQQNINRTGYDEFKNDSEFLNQWKLQYSVESKAYSFSDVEFYLNPYEKQNLELETYCELIHERNYRFRFLIAAMRCIPGEYFFNKICIPCQEHQYSVDYDSNDCIRVNPVMIKNFTRSSIELQMGFWRNSLRSQNIELCYNEKRNCLGGWHAGSQSCTIGHIGALCEECDLYDVRGGGKFQKVSVATCLLCGDMHFQIFCFTLSTIWLLVSTLMTIQSQINQQIALKRLKLYSKLYRILAKFTKDLSGSYIKMLMNSLQIFMAIYSFRLQVNFFSLSFIDQIANQTTQFAYSMECLLVDQIGIPLIYLRVVIIITLQFFYIILANLFHLLLVVQFQQHQYRQSSTITSILYLFMVSQPGLILELGSLITVRKIGDIDWVQSNLDYEYDSSHLVWVYGMALPLLIIVCIVIPSASIISLKLTLGTGQFENLSFLHNEYNNKAYYWEGVKMLQRELILLSMTLYMDHVIIKGLLISIVLWSYTQLVMHYNPFDQRQLNNLEIANMILCGMGIFIGLLLYSAQLDQVTYAINFLSVILLIVVISFGFLNITNLLRTYLEKYHRQLEQLKLKLLEKFPRLEKFFPRIFVTSGIKQKKIQLLFNTMKSIIKSQTFHEKFGSKQHTSKLLHSRDIHLSSREFKHL